MSNVSRIKTRKFSYKVMIEKTTSYNIRDRSSLRKCLALFLMGAVVVGAVLKSSIVYQLKIISQCGCSGHQPKFMSIHSLHSLTLRLAFIGYGCLDLFHFLSHDDRVALSDLLSSKFLVIEVALVLITVTMY